jgi:hypothetical protein
MYNRDISKILVEKNFNEIFGYSSFINPLEYKGKAVKKNDINAKHDGEIIDCPVQKIEEGFIYQKLIDNSFSDNLIMDIRVPVIKKTVDFVYLKYRYIDIRFKNITIKSEIKKTSEIFSSEEIILINEFCKKNHLEYGELDILRDKTDNRIYIIDVNNTPQGPPANTSKKDKKFALNEIAKEFAMNFLKSYE